jgi:UDP-N-acetylmuramoyl-L-alanyl-D-glutamate--2,6-diaminopimelate ligase
MPDSPRPGRPLAELVERWRSEDRRVALAPVDEGSPSHVGAETLEITGIRDDSRTVESGDLFVAIRGIRVDGHDYVRDAIERGAVAAAVEEPFRELSIPQVVVRSGAAALASAAAWWHRDPSRELLTVGITGTNGKTTTSFLARAVLEAGALRTGLIGTIGIGIGGAMRRNEEPNTTPGALDLQRLLREMVEAGEQAVVIETSSHGLAADRVGSVDYDAAIFTNLSHEHLDFHGTMDAYYAAKRRLFDSEPRPLAAVSVDDEWGRRLAAELGSVLTFGVAPDARLRGEGLELGPDGARFVVDGLRLRTHLRGAFNVENVLAAVALARLLDVEDEAIGAGVESLRGVPGRLEPVDEGQPFSVLVDYSHKPEALANVLRTARELSRGRVLVVFGAGGDRDREKRPLMGRIASELADVVVVTSDNPRSEDPHAIVDEILAGTRPDVQVELDRRAAIESAVDQAREGDVLVIAGKGHEPGQEVAGEIHPFDDRDVAREALRAVRA